MPTPPEPVKTKPESPPRKKLKNDPKLVAAARELRDRWLEEVNASPHQAIAGKYDVSRAGDAQLGVSRCGALLIEQDTLALPEPVAA
jgi:hypothetical protein